jgi:D-sedoheptulose 7-phosphate isomerase
VGAHVPELDVLIDFTEQARIITETAHQKSTIWRIAALYTQTLKAGGTLLFCGNGGSCADAQHLATEYVVRFQRNREAYAALALGVDGPTLTATGNDFTFARVFSRPLEALGRANDLLTVLTTSGTSENVILAAQAASRKRLPVVAITGATGFAGPSNVNLKIPTTITAYIQVASMVVGHYLVDQVESLLTQREAAA